MIPEQAIQAAHAAICEQNLDDCLDPGWRGKCVKALEAAAPYMPSLTAAEIEAVGDMVKTAKADGWDASTKLHLHMFGVSLTDNPYRSRP